MVDMAEAAQSLYGDSEPAAETRMSKSISPATALYGETVPDDKPASRNGRPTPPPSIFGDHRPTYIDDDGELSTDAAGTLYEEPAPVNHEDVLSEFGLATPYEIKQERESSLESAFGYNDTSISDEIKTNLGEVIDLATPDIPRTLREAAIIGYGQIASDIGMTHDEVTGLVNVAKSDLKIANDPGISDLWRRQSSDYLRDQYGERANKVLADAQLMVKRDPRLKSMLERTGLGSHPKFVAQLCARAVSMRNAGKLGGRKRS